MSTLLHQLQHLKVAGQPSSLHVASKKRPSLLFDHEEAATVDIEVIYDLGRNGLEELARIDTSLHEYEENLFSEKCIGYERSVQGKQQLQQLDDAVGKFLRQLSPYLMLRAAHKCMEWLIRVFRINSYNVDDVMKCVLPYHDTVLFARIVQLLPLKNKSSFWHWLRPSQKKGSPLAKATLIQHCISVPAFLNFVCDMSEEGSSKIAVNFYCSTIIGVVNAVELLHEWLVVMVIPHITNGLKSSHDHIKAANYIILAHMIQHTVLNDKVANSLLNLLAKNMSESTVREGVMMMCHYCNYQQLKMLSTRAVKYLLDCPQLLPTLTELAGSHDVSIFTGLLLTSLITCHFDKMIGSHGDVVPSTDVVVGMVKEIPLGDAIVVQCVRSLLEGYMKYRDVIGQGDVPVSQDGVHHYCEPIVKAVDTRYSSVMDFVIGDYVTSCDPCHQEWLQEFITLLLPSVKHHVAMDASVVAVVGIHHSNPDVRRLTFSNMCQQIGDEEVTEDNQFVSSSILSHLHDDSNLVVENVISCCIQQKKLLQYIPTECLVDALFTVLSRARSHDPISDQCLNNVMSLLLTVDHNLFTDKMLLRLLPHLLYHYHDDVKVIQSLGVTIATSPLAQTHPLLIGADKMFCSQDYQIEGGQPNMMNNANCLLIGYFAERLASMEISDLTKMVTLILHWCCHDNDTVPSITSDFLFPVVMVTLLLAHPLPQSLNVQIATSLVTMVSSFMPHCVIENITPSLNNAISILVHKKGSQRKQAKYLGNLILWVITMVTKHLVVITDVKSSLWLDMGSCDPVEYHQYCVVLLILYNILVQLLGNSRKNDHCQSIMKTFITVYFKGRGTLLRFLAMIWCAERDMELNINIGLKVSMFSLHTQISSLQYALVFLEAMGPGAVLAVGGVPQCPMVPALLVALLKPDKSLRQAALKCFQLIHTSINVTGVDIMKVDTPFLYLCDIMLHHQVEILADHNAVVVAMAKEMGYVTMDTKQSIISAVVKALMYHVTSCETPTHIQYYILTILSNVHHKVKFDGVMKILRRKISTLSSSDNQSNDQELMRRLIECYNISNSSYVTCDAIKLLTVLLNTNTVQCLVLHQITAEFYCSLKMQYQKILLSVLLDCCLDTSTMPTTSTDIVNVINKLPLSTSNVLSELDNKQLLTTGKSARSKKAKRLKLDTPTEEEFPLDKCWQRVGVILDVIPGSVLPQECYQLVPTLFQLLESCLELGSTLHHVQLQLLHVLYWVVTSTLADVGVEKTREVLPESQFNVDMIIQTIRSSPSTPQIQQQSLSLLSVSATLYPVRILHNIMSIFTFMGVYLSHHDDQYSFEVVLTAMDKLLPMLMSSDSVGRTPKKSSNQITVTAIEITRVFSDAIEHIPDHRQLIVFQKLVNILGAEDYLHVTLLMLLGKQVVKQQQDNQKKTISDFCKHLCNKFPIATQVTSLHRIMEHISHIADVQCVKTGPARKVAMVMAGEIFSLYTHSTKQIQLFKLSTLSLMISVLSCDMFTSKILRNQLSKEQELMFISLLQTTISYIVTINAHHSSGKFYDLIIKKCYNIVDHVTHPLTTRSYVKVMSQLITPESQLDIQRRSLDIIRSHFTSSSQHLASSNVAETLTLLPLLNQLIQHKSLLVHNKVSAILLITTIVHSISNSYHDNIIEVMPHLLRIIKKKSTHSQVLISSIKCISMMVKRLGGHFIPQLPNTVPLIIAKMSSHDCLVAAAAVEGLTSVIEMLPQFLTPYITDIIIQGCNAVVANGHHTTLTVATKHLREQLSTHIPARLLVPSLVQSYDSIATMSEPESSLAFLHILNVSIGKMSVSDVGSHSNELTDLFLKLLEYRSTQQRELLNTEVEDKCVECFTELIVKMSENIFRPVFLRISDWATQSKNKDHLISFYHLADQIAGKLKGLFLLFAGHIIPNCIELLNNMNGGDSQLQQYLLPCLTKCFHYDVTNSFLTASRFNALLDPLVTQVHNITEEDTVHNYLAPCLVEFAAATTDNAHWKKLNHQLLLCSKHDDTKVRQSVLHILMAMYNKLGESLLIMLPETIPFLAELLEDEDEQVEQLCQKFIKIIEELLGESIQQYF